MNYPINAFLNTSSENILSTAEDPSFEKKSSIAWNGTLRNMYYSKGDGHPSTLGANISTKDGYLTYDDFKYKIDFNYLLTRNETITKKASGECISLVNWKNEIHAIFKNNTLIQYYKKIGDEESLEILDVDSAILSSVYDPENTGLVPMLWTLRREELTLSSFRNYLKGTSLDGKIEIDFQPEGFIPLGDLHSATVLYILGKPNYMVGCDDIDHNRSKTFVFKFNGDILTHQIYDWFGCVSVRGVITGEPIPDPEIFKKLTRNNNGTYKWDMYKEGTTTTLAGRLIGGYEPPVIPTQSKFQAIEIERWEEGESVRTNISANDSKIDDSDTDPVQYFVSNFADNQSVYYDYGQGWVKCYVRKINVAKRTISVMDLYTYGAKKINSQPYRRESLIAKGRTAVWSFAQGKLNQRVYTVGDNNKGQNSILALQPFTVEVLPEKDNKLSLNMEVFALKPLSWSFSRSLITCGADHSETFNVLVYDDISLCVDGKIYTITKTSDYEKITFRKLSDYMFITNILDADNLIVENINGSISFERTAIPYNMDCVIDVEDKLLTEVDASVISSNNTFYFAAGYNMAFTSTLSEGKSSSYLLPPLAFPIYVSAAQLTQFITETIDNRGTIIKPVLKGLFNDYEPVDVFYTVQSNSTNIAYMTTNLVKTTEITLDQYDIYGKPTYDIDKNGWSWTISLATVYYPVPIGADIKGYNYITPTIILPQEYAARLYVPAGNTPYAGYLFAQAVYLGNNIFTIYGSNYFYNKQAIYFTGQDNYNTSAQFTCYCLGMEYLANSGSEGFFYSDWAKQMYIFTGSQTLQPSDKLYNVGKIIDAAYSSKEQILYLLSEDNKLLIKSTEDLGAIEVEPNSHIETTNKGIAVVSEKGYVILSVREGENYLPFDIKTFFYGSDEYLIKASNVEFQLYKIAEKPITVEIRIETLSGIERKEQIEKIVIKPSDWKGRMLRHALSIRNNVGNAFSVSIKSDDEMALTYLNLHTEKYSEKTAAKRQ